MKRVLLLSVFFIVLFPGLVFSQQEKPVILRNQIGIQLNPYLNEDFFTFSNFHIVSSSRYCYRVTKNISLGTEFSYIFPVREISNAKDPSYLKIGFLSRYSIRTSKRIQMFAEVSPYYLYIQGETFFPPIEKVHFHTYSFYVAPGLSFYSKNKRFSLDLYYKFSNKRYFYSKYSVISYKFNINF